MSRDEDLVFKDVRERSSPKLSAKRKRAVESPNLGYKKSKGSPTKVITTKNNCQLADQIQDIERELEGANRKDRALKEKIFALEMKRKILTDRIDARGERIGSPRGMTVNAHDSFDRLKRKLERKELIITLIGDVVKLSGLPFEEEEEEI